MNTRSTAGTTSRVHYIDNLRWITISLLVLYHACMAYNTWGEKNYIFFKDLKPLAFVVVLISPWFMPLMFVLAGVSASYSLSKRGFGQFIGERFKRLGIPLVIGLIINTPILSYIADITHNHYQGNFIQHYVIFYSRFTDLSGYDGGFALGHLWFLLALILISLIACVVIRLLPQNRTVLMITGIVLAVVGVAAFDVKPLGKPLITYLCAFLLGYYFFSKKEFVKKLAGFKWEFVAVFAVTAIANAVLYIFAAGPKILNNICNYSSLITGVIALICVAHDHLDLTGKRMQRFSKLSYLFYIIHFPVVVLSQYFLSLTGMSIVLNFFLTLVIAYPVSYFISLLISKVRSYYFG
ncbi:MAG: acyltransferase [Saccharofermentans sp.]|nr:acyltransferase [Saccharofermentans sp.]